MFVLALTNRRIICIFDRRHKEKKRRKFCGSIDARGERGGGRRRIVASV